MQAAKLEKKRKAEEARREALALAVREAAHARERAEEQKKELEERQKLAQQQLAMQRRMARLALVAVEDADPPALFAQVDEDSDGWISLGQVKVACDKTQLKPVSKVGANAMCVCTIVYNTSWPRPDLSSCSAGAGPNIYAMCQWLASVLKSFCVFLALHPQESVYKYFGVVDEVRSRALLCPQPQPFNTEA